MTKLPAMLALLVVLALPVAGEAAISAGCLPSPLPAVPVEPVFTLDTVASDGDMAHLDIWRHTCLDATGSVVLVRVTPTSLAPFVCSGFDVVQAGAQHTVFLFLTPGGSSLCFKVLVPVTTILAPQPLGPPVSFDDTQAFTLFFDGTTLQSVDIPAAGPPPPVPPSLIVSALGCTTCHPGDTLGFEVRITNPGGPMLVELKAGARRPDGSAISLLRGHEEGFLPSGATVIPLLAGFVLPAGIPAGAYAIEAALLEPELGVTISRHSLPLTVAP
jgi:hypothetical protein